MTTQPLGPTLPALYSLETEAALVGAILIAPYLWPTVEYVPAEALYLHKHRWVWEAVRTLNHSGEVPDCVTVANALEHAGRLDDIGGQAYLIHLMEDCVSSANADSYAAEVMSDWARRQAVDSLGEIAKEIYGSNGDLPAVLERGAARLDGLAPRESHHERLGAIGWDWLEEFGEYVASGKLPGLTTGYPVLDRKTHGLKRGELTLLAGRPSMGKSALAFQIARRQAATGLRVGIFSMEMTCEAVFERIALAEINLDKFKVQSQDLAHLRLTLDALAELPIVICDESLLTVGQIGREAREMERTLGGLDSVIVDHIGYVQHQGAPGDKEYTRIGNTSKALARLGKQMDCSVLALCQLNRAMLATADKEPDLEDLRDSGHLEQDARQVWMLHRPGYYAPTDRQPRRDAPQEAYVIVRKNQNGPRGDAVPLAYVDQSARFSEWETRSL